MQQLLQMLAVVAVCWLVPAAASAAAARYPTQAPISAAALIFLPPRHAGGPTQCNDAFYHYLPGLTNFCDGVHDWEAGHYDSAIEFLQLAAGWGSKGAQYMLGTLHYNGRHVPVDHALGIAWLELADERHNNQQIATILHSAIKYATPTERQRAQRLFQTMSKRYGDKVAAKHAWKQFTNYRKLVAYEMGGTLGGSGSNACVFVPHGPGATLGLPQQLSPTSNPGSNGNNLARRRNSGQLCVPLAVFDAEVRSLGTYYFHGWIGHVNVEPLQQIH